MEDALEPSEFARVLEEKHRGNEAFQAGDWSRAQDLYEEALEVYDAQGIRLGTPGVQRETKVTLFSNLSECYLRLKDYYQAEQNAKWALDIDDGCVKARVRRVKAIVGDLEDDGVLASDYMRIEALRCDLDRFDVQQSRTLMPHISRLMNRIDALAATAERRMDAMAAPPRRNYPGNYPDYDDDEPVGPFGFSAADEEELLCQGVKPWDDDAPAVLAALNGDYDDYGDYY